MIADKIMDFDPVFFPSSKNTSSKFVIVNCISAFSMRSEYSKTLLSFDQNIMSEFLQEHPEMIEMEVLSVFYNYREVIKVPFHEGDLPTALQKLFAIGTFSTQLAKTEMTSYLDEIPLYISTIINATKIDFKLAPLSWAAVAYLLSSIANRYRDINILNPESERFRKILLAAIQYKTSQTQMCSEANELFQEFFMTALFAFPTNALYSKEIMPLLTSTLNFVDKGLAINGCDNFNYIGICNHLMMFAIAKDFFSLGLRLQIFLLITSIAIRRPLVISIIFDTVFLGFIVDLINEVIQTEPVQHEPFLNAPPDYTALNTADVPSNEIVSLTFGESSVPVLSPEERAAAVAHTPPALPQLYAGMNIPPNLSKLLQALSRLCTADNQNRTRLHITILHSFISQISSQPSFDQLYFMAVWSSVFLCLEDTSIQQAARIGFFSFFLRCSFITVRSPELQTFICELFPYLITRTSDPSFMSDLFTFYIDDLLCLRGNDCILKSLLRCCINQPDRCALVMERTGYISILAQSMLELRKQHIANLGLENEKRIEHARLGLFRLLDVMMSISSFKILLLKCTTFVNGLVTLAYEANTSQWTFTQIFIMLTNLNASQPNLSTVFKFYKAQFKVATLKGGMYLSMSKSLLDTIANAVPYNTEELAISFIKHNFIAALIQFVGSTHDKANVLILLQIFQIFATVRGVMRQQINRADLFSKLAPLFEPFFEKEIDTELIKRLWSIAFGTPDVDVSRPYPIDNAQPLPLIFRLFNGYPSNQIWMMKYITKCCEIDEQSALEVNMSTLMSELLSLMSTYRDKSKPDEMFEAAASLFVVLAGRNMRGRDIQSTFRLLTALPGNFRPYFTLDVLQLIMSVFQNPFDSPTSMFSLGRQSILKPLFLRSVDIKEATFFIDIAFEDKSSAGDLLYIEMQNGGKLRLYIRDMRLYFEGAANGKNFNGSFDYTFIPQAWTNTAVAFKLNHIILYANGKEQANVNFPMMFRLRGDIKTGFVGRGIRCKLGSFGLLNTAISREEASMYSNFPRTYLTTFNTSEQYEFPSEFRPLFNGPFSRNTLFFFDAGINMMERAVSFGRVISPLLEVSGKVFGYMPRVKDTLHLAGGTTTLLPLFAQLDYPLLPKENPVYKFEADYLPFLLQVLSVVLKGSFENQRDFALHNGFGILSYLLTKCSIQHITMQVIEQLKRMYAMIEDDELAFQMMSAIFINPRLWVYLDENTQVGIYRWVVKTFDESGNKRQQWFVDHYSYRNFLKLIRVCMWTNFTDKSICLLDQPKINPVTKEVEAERPKNMSAVRSPLWSLCNLIARKQFSPADAQALCFFSFDIADTALSTEIFARLIEFLRVRNQTLIEILKQGFTFQSFFPLMISSSEVMRLQVIHLFVILNNLEKKYNEVLLSPFTVDEWLHGIVTTYSMVNTTILSADVVFGYMFKLYSLQSFDFVPQRRVSQGGDISGMMIGIPAFLPLALLTLTELPTQQAELYLRALNFAYQNDINAVKRTSNPEQAILQYIMHRMPNADSPETPDVMVALTVLLRMLIDNINCLKGIAPFIQLISSRTRHDYSHILRLVFCEFARQVMINQTSATVPDKTVYEFLQIVFDFMFIIPDYDRFYLVDPPKDYDTSPISFQELHRIKLNGSQPNIKFTYATRTFEGYWLDSALAASFLNVLQKRPDLLKQRTSINVSDSAHHPLHMYGFTLGHALSLPAHFGQFAMLIRSLMNILPKDSSMREFEKSSFSAMISGLFRCARATKPLEKCHVVFYETSKAFAHSIASMSGKQFRYDSVDVFNSVVFTDSCFIQYFLEHHSRAEEELLQYATRTSKSTTKSLQATARANEKYASHFSNLNVFESNSFLERRNTQIHLQLLEYAFRYRNIHGDAGRSYRRIYRHLSGENGPWCRPERTGEHFYKIDRRLQGLKRPRLRENYNYDDHKEASILRDIGNVQDAMAQLQEHLKKIAFKELSGEESVLILDEDEKTTVNRAATEDDVMMKTEVRLITMKRVAVGTLLLTRKYIVFEGSDNKKYFRVPLDTIQYVLLRRYLLDDTAVEIFSTNGSTRFFDFGGGARSSFLRALKRQSMPSLKHLQMSQGDIKYLVNDCLAKWNAGELSNFDFIMQLNIFSGRSYNDLSQYPVFPWVLKDYKSSELDLDDPSFYRDLSRPIGTLDEERFEVMKERMLNESENSEMRYLYGSFYSSSAVVVGFLIRLEPFTSLHIELQSGRFDHEERLFMSIPKAWESVQKTQMDFRELTPEFYYLPDFLVNSNKFDLGKNFGAGDVILPPWASSPTDFVMKNRRALESEYVSQHLHEWIELIFGVKQSGIEAEKADNVFCPYFFPSFLTPEVRSDPSRMKFVQEYAACFGQAPLQLFKKPLAPRQNMPATFSSFASIRLIYKGDVRIVSADLSEDILRITTSTLTQAKISIAKNRVLTSHERILLAQSSIVACNAGDVFFHSTDYDCSFHVDSLVPGANESITKRLHTQRISAMVASERYLATCSEDGTVALWQLQSDIGRGGDKLGAPVAIVNNHPTPVVCAAINERADLLVSASTDGTIIAFSLERRECLKSALLEDEEPISVSVSDAGLTLVNASAGDCSVLRLFDANMTPVCSKQLPVVLIGAVVFDSADGGAYVVYCEGCNIAVCSVPTFEVVWKEQLPDPVTTVSIGVPREGEITPLGVQPAGVSRPIVFGCSDGSVYALQTTD